MAGVTYFQRYAQRENHVTNNTLLVLRHLNQFSPAKLEAVLRGLLGDDRLTLGPTFTQQVVGARSVPDALIEQAPFRLYIETKLTQALDLRQLKNHIRSIVEAGGGRAILVGLSTAPLQAAADVVITGFANDQGVAFRSVTFRSLADALLEACTDYEVSLKAVVRDYVDFLTGERLLYANDDWMLVVPCGLSYAENKTFGVYYDDVDRPRRAPCSFLDIYKDKQITLVGAIRAVLHCDCRDGIVKVLEAERGEADADALDRIKGIVEATGYYDLVANPQRYYVVDRFVETDLAKVSKGPVRGAQYLQISPLIEQAEPPKTAQALADALRGRNFPLSAAADASDDG
jgi:hypothetical protein